MISRLRRSVNFVAVLAAGLVAGLLLGTAMEQGQLTVLDAANWTLARQSIDSVFSRVLPWVWNTTLILLFVAAYLNARRSRWLFLLASLLLLAGIVMTVTIEVPINKQIASWSPLAVPENWSELRSKWLIFHNARTVAGIVAFVSALAGVMQR